MILNIIFDFGGVLFPVQPYLDKTAQTPEKFRQIKQLVIDLYDERKMNKSYLEENILRMEHERFSQEELNQIHQSLTVIDEELFEYIKRLSRQYPLYALVNEAPKWTEVRRGLFNLDRYFKNIFVSSDIGYFKPDPQSYLYLIEKTGIEPSLCLFVDDDEENVAAAQKAGMNGVVYKNVEQLKQLLENEYESNIN